MSCDLMLMDHVDAGHVSCADPKHGEALRARRSGAEPWSLIVQGNDRGGERDFLDGEPIHCGAVLELQAFEVHDDDYGSYNLKLDQGARVRYEIAWAPRKHAVLHASVAGHEFTRPLERAWMRFRWPPRRRS